MLKSMKYVLGSTILIGGLAVPVTAEPRDAAANDRAAVQSEKQAQPQLPNGFQLKNLDQIDNIREELRTTVGAALDDGHFGKLIGNLAVVNRDQMKDFKNEDFKTLDGVIKQIRQNWKQKYGHDFKITDANEVFVHQDVVVQGVVTNAQVAATTFPVPPETNAARLASGQTPGSADRARTGENRGQANDVLAKDLQDSKGVAIARIPMQQKLPQVDVSMIEEGHGKWRILVPPGTSAQQIHTQLQNELTYIGRSANQWPDNENQAYEMVGHRVLMALYDINAPEAGHVRQ